MENCLDYRTLKHALASLPKTLDETYSRILHAIPAEYKQCAIFILQLITFSERPLRIEEVVDAIAVDTAGPPYFCPRDRMPDPQEITRYCSSLVATISIANHSNSKANDRVELQLAHFSVKEYLTSNRLDSGIAQVFQEPTARAAIANVSLAYLLHFNKEIPPKEIIQRYPFAQYSARYWMTNVAGAKDTDERVLKFIKQLFCYHSCSYKICYNLYQPDQPWKDHPWKDRHHGSDGVASELYYAAFEGLLHEVDYLLNQGIDVNIESGFHGSALQAASIGGHEQIVRLLVDKGADVNMEGGEYGSALQAASYGGHEQIVRLLVDKGADVNMECGGYYGSALQAASIGGHEQIVKLLVSKGAVKAEEYENEEGDEVEGYEDEDSDDDED